MKFGPVHYITEWICSTRRDGIVQEKKILLQDMLISLWMCRMLNGDERACDGAWRVGGTAACS